jgi:hypothetical protein
MCKDMENNWDREEKLNMILEWKSRANGETKWFFF